MLSLREIVEALAVAMTRADARRPAAKSHRGDREYRPGIGPHSENAAIALTLPELPSGGPCWRQFIPYPAAPRQKCDLGVTDGGWVVEVKMARLRGDNGKPDDTALKDILSPYEGDRSALTDCVKLATSGFTENKAVVIYVGDHFLSPLLS